MGKLSAHTATFYGVLAILFWSTIVGLIKRVSEDFGPAFGAALIYTLGSVMLLLVTGFPAIRRWPRRYLIWGTLLFVSYEICFILALGFSQNRQQAIELGMVNYLWPSLTVGLAVLMGGQRLRLPLIAGLVLAVLGISRVIGGENGLSLSSVAANVALNPLSYSLAFAGAVIWAFYSNLSRRLADGNNGITLFFIITALMLWVVTAFDGITLPAEFSVSTVGFLIAAAALSCAANALWTIAVLRGNVALIGTLSYFTPVLSTAFSALLLSTALSFAFWQGVLMVTGGSLLCWLATRRK